MASTRAEGEWNTSGSNGWEGRPLICEKEAGVLPDYLFYVYALCGIFRLSGQRLALPEAPGMRAVGARELLRYECTT
jgi:hypothetical protein